MTVAANRCNLRTTINIFWQHKTQENRSSCPLSHPKYPKMVAKCFLVILCASFSLWMFIYSMKAQAASSWPCSSASLGRHSWASGSRSCATVALVLGPEPGVPQGIPHVPCSAFANMHCRNSLGSWTVCLILQSKGSAWGSLLGTCRWEFSNRNFWNVHLQAWSRKYMRFPRLPRGT